jgi:threonine synthase
MKYYYTDGTLELSNLKDAITNAMPTPNGLWLPQIIPKLDNFNYKRTFHEIAFDVLRLLLSDEIPSSTLKTIIKEAFNFPIPLVHLHDNIHILELFHGPTLTFKDIGARFMALIIRYLVPNKTINVVVATSGDTGSAVADAFSKIPNVNVNVFYPSGLISHVQEKQITSYGNNVKAYSVEGNFDDCQDMVKQLLRDKVILSESFIFPANSINIIRLIPQTIYYFWAYSQLNTNSKVNFCVPSGNLGNLTAGIIANLMGLPVNKFIVATNINKAFGTYLQTGTTIETRAIPSLSSAMDISIPNNLIRLKYLFNNNNKLMQEKTISYSITDKETLQTISTVFEKTNYMMDPHTSVGYTAIEKYNSVLPTILLSTAHPSKFPEVMKQVNMYPINPPQLLNSLNKETHKIIISKSYNKWINTFGKNITLIGMPASGKSTLGKLLASKMNKLFVDTDTVIEQANNCRLAEITKQGNDIFLDIEEKTILNLQCKNTIIATGGSVVYSDKAMKYLKRISTIVYLDVSLKLLLERLNNVIERGVVLKAGQTIEDLFNERTPLYEQYSQIKVPSSSVNNIINRYITYNDNL